MLREDTMPGFLMHVGATVMCSHGGSAQPLIPNPRVMVGGQPVVCITSPYQVVGCPFFIPPFGPPMPCITGQFVVGATRLMAGGQPIALASGSSICTPNGTPLVIVATQTRVKGT
jgi:hypothetical protein